jgi:hypothetical protein
MSEEEKGNGLSKDSTVNDVFEFLDLTGGGVRVVPLTIDQDEKDTRLLMVIRGEHNTASTIQALLMEKVQELFDLQTQAEASEKPRIQRV